MSNPARIARSGPAPGRPMVEGKGDVVEGVEGNTAAQLPNLVIAVAVSVGIAGWVYAGAPGLG